MYLVTGGRDPSSTSRLLATTELRVRGAAAWTLAAPLPAAVRGPAAVSMGNVVYLLGQEYCSMIICCYMHVAVLRRVRWNPAES